MSRYQFARSLISRSPLYFIQTLRVPSHNGCSQQVKWLHDRQVVESKVNDFPEVTVDRDVRYSNDHSRNVLDIYQPNESHLLDGTTPKFLFVHGGMWIRGSKEQNSLSAFKIMSALAHQAYTQLTSVEEEQTIEEREKEKFSNVGLCISQNGGVAYVMNYRLAAETSPEEKVGHPHQVMDVARAIAFILEYEMKRNSCVSNFYIGGHSAGAHLAALALAEPRYLYSALDEKGMDRSTIKSALAGFVGISGVYNLRRLAMGSMAQVTLGPAFIRDDNIDDGGLLVDASPVHLLIEQSIDDSTNNQNRDKPLLAECDILLLNAESDFQLGQDSAELLVALQEFHTNEYQRQTTVIDGRNHLSIMTEFGRGLFSEGGILRDDTVKHGAIEVRSNPNKGTQAETARTIWSNLLVQPTAFSNSAKETISLSPFEESPVQPDNAALKMLEFMKINVTR